MRKPRFVSLPSRYHAQLLRLLNQREAVILLLEGGMAWLRCVPNSFDSQVISARTLSALREARYLKWQGRSRRILWLSVKGRKAIKAYEQKRGS